MRVDPTISLHNAWDTSPRPRLVSVCMIVFILVLYSIFNCKAGFHLMEGVGGGEGEGELPFPHPRTKKIGGVRSDKLVRVGHNKRIIITINEKLIHCNLSCNILSQSNINFSLKLFLLDETLFCLLL